MADVFTPEKRSEVMSRIRGRDTKPELAVRSMLHRLGYRFTVNGPKNKSLPGKPDIVLPKYRCGRWGRRIYQFFLDFPLPSKHSSAPGLPYTGCGRRQL
ncbi:MAG: hypothetical protein K9M97_08140 [Akkermansiaceae bacterium]|nr:hypothetical protein [Akkermansiaceae bacterium]